jgi:pilus assembly protein Flp/PilA
MNRIGRTLLALWTEQEGLTTVEYAVAGALIAATLVATFQALGLTVQGVINGINTQLGG